MSIIGICGNARSGKDTMADLIIEVLSDIGVKSAKTAFANELKKECRDFVMNTIGIDTFTEKTEEKNIIRPLLVTWGSEIRRKLNPDVWVEKVEKSLAPNQVTIISDVRFENEFNWLRGLDSYCIFVDRVDENGNQVQPANDYEKENNEFLRANCDFHLTWSTVGDGNLKALKSVVIEVLEKTIDPNKIAQWTQTFV
jgi:hypothetical protein